jgi:hypothetical protein
MNPRHLATISVNLLVLLLLLTGSIIPPGDRIEGVRAFTRDIEFDFIGWILNAMGTKLTQAALGTGSYLAQNSRRQVILDYLDLVDQIQQDEAQSLTIYADPDVSDPEGESAPLRAELELLYAHRARIGPVAEAVLQDQLAQTVHQMDLSMGGQPLPPILYHSTPLPSALIVSPRDKIQQDADISLIPGLTVEQRADLEDQVDKAMDVSSLVVGIGGIGVYPTMVMQTNDLNWLAEVVAHEWVHNFLTLRPLGINYLSSPELRTMNETAASIAGKEIGRALMERYYPELLPPPPPEDPPAPAAPVLPDEPPAFNFQEEMHLTRVTVDGLLADGRVEEAEAYMEERRVFFWDQGYRIRKLNQAYFAFYGAYADVPAGAAGEDPVGAAVRLLRAQSPSLSAFLKRISWISSFEDLQKLVGVNP